MDDILDTALQSVLSEYNQNEHIAVLSQASDVDIASYDRHWSKLTGGATQPVDSAAARHYLSSELVSDHVVQAVLDHLHLSQSSTLTREQFYSVSHLVYSTVNSAQDSLFDSEGLWADALPPSASKRKTHAKTSRQERWKIGSFVAAHESALDEAQGASMSTENSDIFGSASTSAYASYVSPEKQQQQQGGEEGSSAVQSPKDSSIKAATNLDSALEAAAQQEEDKEEDERQMASPAPSHQSPASADSISPKDIPSSPSAITQPDPDDGNPEQPTEDASTAGEWGNFKDAFAALALTRPAPQPPKEQKQEVAGFVTEFPSLDQPTTLSAAATTKGTVARSTVVGETGYVAATAQAFESFDALPSASASASSSGPSSASQATTTSNTSGDTAGKSDVFQQLRLKFSGGAAPQALEPMTVEDQHRCGVAYSKQGFEARGGVLPEEALRYFKRSGLPQELFIKLWSLADVAEDGRLNQQEFAIYLHLLRLTTSGYILPTSLSPAAIAALLYGTTATRPSSAPGVGIAPLPHGSIMSSPAPSSKASSAQKSSKLRINSAKLKAAIDAGRGMAAGNDLDHDDNDDIVGVHPGSSVPPNTDSDFPATNPMEGSDNEEERDQDDEDYHDFNSDHDGMSTDMESVLSGFSGMTASTAGNPYRYRPQGDALNAMPMQRPEPSSRFDRNMTWEKEAGGHSHLQIQIIAADVKYNKNLDRPFVSVSIVDMNGRLIELPQDTHPGTYRRDTCSAFFNHVVSLKTPLKKLPPGCAVLMEIKHWKSSSKKFSTLAWAHVLLDAFVDFGPLICKVRHGSFLGQLYKKPVGQVHKARILGSQPGKGLHMLVRGVDN